MKKKYVGLTLIPITLLLMAACSSVTTHDRTEIRYQETVSNKVFMATGHSQFVHNGIVSNRQRRIDAEQTAKLNAYRLLAADLYQQKLPGGYSVGRQVMKDETYRLYFDTFLRGAKVHELRLLGNTFYVTLALTVGERFYHCMTADLAIVDQCLQQTNRLPFTRLGYHTAKVKTISVACGSVRCNGFFDIAGFSRGKNMLDRGLLDAGLYDSEWLLNTSARLAIHYLILNGIPK